MKSQTNVSDSFNGSGKRKSGEGPSSQLVQCSDLVELVLEPLSNQIDRTRLEVLGKLHEVSESVDMVARQMRRQTD